MIPCLLACPLHGANAQQSAAVKREVIFGNLAPDGHLTHAYILNCFSVTDAGLLLDYGDYSETRVLQGKTLLTKAGMNIGAYVRLGEFSYMGVLNARILPWKIRIRYWLDGVPIKAENLFGKNGRVRVQFEITPSEAAPQSFAAAYGLDVQIELDVLRCYEVFAPNAVRKCAGGAHRLLWRVPPGLTGKVIHLETDVRDCRLPSVRIEGRRHIGGHSLSYASIQNKAVEDVAFLLRTAAFG